MTSDTLAARGLRVRKMEWEAGTYTTTDDDGGPREGSPRRLFAWRSHPYLIILQDGDRGMYILRGKSDGIGLVVSTLEAAKAAAQSDYEARILSALEATDE